MTDSSLKLNEMQRTSIEFERQRHLVNWFIKSGPHMPIANTNTAVSTSAAATTTSVTPSTLATSATAAANITEATTSSGIASKNINNSTKATNAPLSKLAQQQQQTSSKSSQIAGAFFLMSSDGHAEAITHPNSNNNNNSTAVAMSGFNLSRSAHIYTPSYPNHPPATPAPLSVAAAAASGHISVEGRKPKLRRFNSHDTSSNMFSVADFENARLARRNEIELKQRMARRMRSSGNAVTYGGNEVNFASGLNGDYSTAESKTSKYSNESQQEPLVSDVFLERFSLPRVVRISYKTKFSNETLQSSSSNDSSTATSHSSHSATAANMNNSALTGTTQSGGSSSAGGHCTGTGTSSSTASSTAGRQQHNPSTTNAGEISTFACEHQDQGELFLLYRLVKQRYIYHGHNAKTMVGNRKKGVLIPQEFPGYFSLINDKGQPTANLYTSLMQLVRERVYKFVSVDNMAAFTESQPNANSKSAAEGCLPLYSSQQNTNNRPQYVKTTARGGQVFRLLAVYEDGKQDYAAISNINIAGNCAGNVTSAKANGNHGREKEKGRYAQLLNENRQVLYVSLSTKGKFYEIEPGIPQILQKLTNDSNKKINPECVHRITSLVGPNKELPYTLRYISGPSGCANVIPEQLCISRISLENIIIACPIEDVEEQNPLHLRKLHLTKEMYMLKDNLGFENQQRMLANPNVQNILKYCQFNCDQFLKMVEIEVLNRSERSGSKNRGEGLKILKPLHLPKLLRREKTTIPAHEKEDSIIFLSKSELASLGARDKKQQDENNVNATLEHSVSAGRISDKMKVFQSTKKKWFRKQDKNALSCRNSLDLSDEAKRLSMERYTDVSKLLQQRFGEQLNDPPETASERSGASDIGCSDTETSTLTTLEEKLKKFGETAHAIAHEQYPTLQKSISLQDIELISSGNCAGQKNKHDLMADTISEAKTDIDDTENRNPAPQIFITQKLYTEFHVKTRQYSKSSSSLNQLINFSKPQRLNEQKRTSLSQIKTQATKPTAETRIEKRLPEFNIGEPVTGRRAAGEMSIMAAAAAASHGNSLNSQNTSLISPLTPTSLIEDDLPYSNVRDSLVFSNDEQSPNDGGAQTSANTNICQALHMIDYEKENIYAEICHEASAMGGLPSSQTKDTFSADTHSTQVSCTGDEFGDYASLTYDSHAIESVGNAITRVQVNISPSPMVSYHTVYLGDEALGEKHANKRNQVSIGQSMRDCSHITTVELEGVHNSTETNNDGENIYSTLK